MQLLINYITNFVNIYIYSLEVANVLGISKRIRKHCLFKDYEDLRAFWKNMVRIGNLLINY